MTTGRGLALIALLVVSAASGGCAAGNLDRVREGMAEPEVRRQLGSPSAEITDTRKIETLTPQDRGCRRDAIRRILIYDYWLRLSALVYLDAEGRVVCTTRASVRHAPP
jgi:hypothetical protein